MSCNGCRVLRKGCSESCVLRSCLHWIKSPEAQGHATLFLSKFFGRSDLLSLVSAVPESQRPALFQSLLFEACGRTVNPVNGAVGLLTTGNWQVCQAAVETVLSGGTLLPLPAILDKHYYAAMKHYDSSDSLSADICAAQSMWLKSSPLVNAAKAGNQPSDLHLSLPPKVVAGGRGGREKRSREASATQSFEGDEVSKMTSLESSGGDGRKKLLNLFV